ncbi:MAG: penicillin acylase family protein [Pseudomonadota bacterium]
MILLFVAGGVYIWWHSAVPTYSGTFQTGVKHPVTISFDDKARPYVIAQNWEDAYFAQGWLHARERLWQMEMFRRAGKGRIAQVLGPSGLNTDIELWRAGVPELAQRLTDNTSRTLHHYIEHYTAGVNAWLTSGANLPPEFVLAGFEVEPWATEDVYALGALMAYQSANNKSNELLRLALQKQLGDEAASIFSIDRKLSPTDDDHLKTSHFTDRIEQINLSYAVSNPRLRAPSSGSNSWAVSPQLTESGKALFAFDSHDAMDLPNLTYDIHMFVGEEQIRGASVAGLLGVINGYNEFMAWGFTNIGDSQDLFVETRDITRPGYFKDKNGWYRAPSQELRIPVKGKEDYALTLVITKNGRLISDEPAISARWAPLESHTQGLDALYKLNRATSYQEFMAAMDEFVAPSANVTYADITGRIAQRTIGLLPRRGLGKGLVPLDGSKPSHRWQGMLDMRQLPRLENPQSGYVLAANEPFHKGAPLVSADNATGYRAERITEYLAQNAPHSIASMQTLQTDTKNLQATQILPRMLKAIPDDLLTEPEKQYRTALVAWLDEPYDQADRVEPLLFAMWYQNLIAELFQKNLGEALYNQLLGRTYLVNEAIDRHLLMTKSTQWDIHPALVTSFKTSVAYLERQPAMDWGGLHQLTLNHAMSGAFPFSEVLLDRGPYRADGGNTTVGRARYSLRRPYAISGGATSRLVLEMSQPIQAYMTAPGGQAGHPGSRHYNDQTQDWLDGNYDRIPDYPDSDMRTIQLLP